jgi:hypothetical protein
METPQFNTTQFLDATTLNRAAQTLFGNSKLIGSVLFTAGLFNQMSLMSSSSGLQVMLDLPSPFAVLFANGSLVAAHGVNNNADTQSYEVDLTPLAPSTGSVTAYIVASLIEIQQDPFTVTGPPIGHPDYNPTFAPYVAQSTNQYSLAVTATLTAPDNMTSFELGRYTLGSGQSNLPSMTTTHQMQGGVNGPMAMPELNTLRANGFSQSPTANETLLLYTFPFTASINLSQSVANALVAPANSVSYKVMYYMSNSMMGTQIGTINFNAGALVGAFSNTTATIAMPGDRIVVIGPNSADASLAGVAVNIVSAIDTAM